jgi:hypothetical protein
MFVVKFFNCFLIVCFLLGGSVPVFAQEENSNTDDDTIVFYIRDISFDITGLTRPSALIYQGDLRTGERIIGRENLEQYRRRKITLLHNQRVLDAVDITYTLGEAGPDGAVPVDLLVTSADTRNIIVLPYLKFDDNTGAEITVKARDYNFLGTMIPLRVDLGYKLGPEEVSQGFFSNLSKGAFVFALDSDMPFSFLGYNWNVNFDHAFSYTYLEPLYYKNTTGLSMEFPLGLTTFTFGFEEAVVVNEDNAAAYTQEYVEARDGRYQDFFLASELSAAWKIPTGFLVADFGELTYTPRIAGSVNYRPLGNIGDLRRGPVLTLSQNLGFGRINWVENFRSGLESYIESGIGYNFFREAWNRNVISATVLHLPVTDFFGISARIQYRQYFDQPNEQAGDVLRGILNQAILADFMVSLNLDFPIRVLRFLPSQWFNSSFFRFFDLELHLSPIFDMALWRNYVDQAYMLRETAGLELMVFLFSWRSIYLRISYAVNFYDLVTTGKMPQGNNREIFIGFGHHY